MPAGPVRQRQRRLNQPLCRFRRVTQGDASGVDIFLVEAEVSSAGHPSQRRRGHSLGRPRRDVSPHGPLRAGLREFHA